MEDLFREGFGRGATISVRAHEQCIVFHGLENSGKMVVGWLTCEHESLGHLDEAMTEALVNPEMLRWARERAGMSLRDLADKLKSTDERIAQWEKGDRRPTFAEAEKFAKQLHLPFGYLYLPSPPVETLPIPDYRTLDPFSPQQPSLDLREVIQDLLYKQDWYREFRQEHGVEPLPFIGRFKLGDPVEAIAADIRRELDWKTIRDIDRERDFLFCLRERCEEIGLWIAISGIVKSNTHRSLSVQEFRGFVLSDPLAPMIFINGKDAKAAQVFTMVHELAHLWLGESGISNPSPLSDQRPSHRLEQVCNAVAAEVLVPRKALLSQWRAGESLEEHADRLTALFHVSPVVIARRALELGKITREAFQEFYLIHKSRWEQLEKKKSSGGDYYKTAPVQNGKAFTQAVLSAAMSGRLLLRDAGRLLHVNPANLSKLYQKLQG